MKVPRLFFHPLLENKVSRRIFALFFLLGFGFFALIFWQGDGSLHQAHILGKEDTFPLSLMTSGLVQFSYFFVVVLICSAVCGSLVVGPIARIEQWLRAWESGHQMKPLRVRWAPEFLEIVDLINALYERKTDAKNSTS